MICNNIGNRNPIGLQKVFIAMDDSSNAKIFMEQLEKMIFTNFNCSIYTSPDGDVKELQEYIPLMDVVIFIITLDMLCSVNVNIIEILPICDRRKIPVIPLLLNSEMEKYYSYIFQEKQYLCPNDYDNTKITFKQKLIDRLSSILLHDELIDKIHKVFHKMLFLSYRKKNRNEANKLMKLIHCNKLFNNVAIWYDERITVGESFNDEIENALKKSDWFILLATDAVLEMPNYVHDVEYKKALKIKNLFGKIIAIRLDKEPINDSFYDLYKTIPRVYSGVKYEFYDRLMEITGSSTVDDANSLYLLGLAYQNGICVEINPKLAIELLVESAKQANKSAMIRLVDTYVEGIGVKKNYYTAIKWQKKLIKSIPINSCIKEFAKLANIYEMIYNWDKAIHFYRKALKNWEMIKN